MQQKSVDPCFYILFFLMTCVQDYEFIVELHQKVLFMFFVYFKKIMTAENLLKL